MRRTSCSGQLCVLSVAAGLAICRTSTLTSTLAAGTHHARAPAGLTHHVRAPAGRQDRVHRIGQPQSVNIYYLHVRGSVDDIMWGTLQTKLENVGQARAPAAPAGQACTRSVRGFSAKSGVSQLL